uniref:Uncharacterized protein n=1 Tax=Dulem virus 35 TaxID=3145753 RepID=A0AAU8B0P4_9CAUD
MAYPAMPGYPVYQQPYPQPYQDRLAQLQAQYQNVLPQMPAQAPPQTNQGLLWVQGEAGAKSYLVAPNTTVLLMDSEAQRFYLKSTDGAGMPSLRTFEYAEVGIAAPAAQKQPEMNLDDKYVTRAEYEALRGRYAEILDRLNKFPMADDSGNSTRKTETRNGGARNKGGTDNE